MKNLIIIFLVVIVIGSGIYFLIPSSSLDKGTQYQNEIIDIAKSQNEENPVGTQTEETNKSETVLGKSVEGKNIMAYHYGDGDTEILFVGGIHGGYEWNTTLLAREATNYLKTNPEIIPSNVKVTIIPVLNPDGLIKVVGTSTPFLITDVPTKEADTIIGRFNANEVDLNRNFDCNWQSTGTWQNKDVSGGSKVFSEPESQAIKNYIDTKKPKAVIVWYSAAGGVYASNCNNDILNETSVITKIYADAAGYPSFEEFDSYSITGDMVNWLAKINIPAISVLLTNHQDTEWNKNKAGIEAILNHYAL